MRRRRIVSAPKRVPRPSLKESWGLGCGPGQAGFEGEMFEILVLTRLPNRVRAEPELVAARGSRQAKYGCLRAGTVPI
jgi:hypothetical protein